jgi:hypothetical protein
VVSGGKLIGLVSIGDVVKQRVEEVERESERCAQSYPHRLAHDPESLPRT